MRVMRMGVVLGMVLRVMGFGFALMAEFADQGARRVQERQRVPVAIRGIPGKPWRHFRPDPDQQIRLGERAGLRRPKLIIMRIGPLLKQHSGRPEIAHDLGDKRLHGRNIGHHRRRRGSGETGQGKKGERKQGGTHENLCHLRLVDRVLVIYVIS